MRKIRSIKILNTFLGLVVIVYSLLLFGASRNSVLAQSCVLNECPPSWGDDFCNGGTCGSGCATNICPAACGEVAPGTYGSTGGSCGIKRSSTAASGVAPYVTPSTCTVTGSQGSWCHQWQYCCTICVLGDCGTPGGSGSCGDGTCNAGETAASCPADCPGSGCAQSGWINQGCGIGGCAADQMRQTQTVSPAGCALTSQCVASAICTGTPSSCDFTVANTTLNGTGSTSVVTLSAISEVGSTISSVTFSSFAPSVANVTSPDLAPAPYRTTVTATGIGNTSVLARAIMNDGTFCQKPFNVTVNNPTGWFQMIDGDIVSWSGNISNPIPATCVAPGCNPFTSIDPPPNSPGLVVAAGNISSGAGGPS